MNSFLLYWNPHFSSYTVERCLHDFAFAKLGRDVLTETENDWDRSPDYFNWSIVDHKILREGDRFFFVRCGYEKPTGLVGTGYFSSSCCLDRDWSGQGRKVFYADMNFDAIVNPESSKIFPSAALAAAIPGIDWSRGYAGTLIDPAVAERLETLWNKHLSSF